LPEQCTAGAMTNDDSAFTSELQGRATKHCTIMADFKVEVNLLKTFYIHHQLHYDLI
jgi:hypothetical protein